MKLRRKLVIQTKKLIFNMNNKKKVLGKGLDAILGSPYTDITSNDISGDFVAGAIANILIKNIEYNPFQPRDNYTCQKENCSYCHNKKGVSIHPHHIKAVINYPELAFNENNGITYCADYHLKSGLHRRIQGGALLDL